MNRDTFDEFCASLPATTHVVQWGNASVWKVGGKIFAVCPETDTTAFARPSFKCSDTSFEILCELENVIPSPYLARAKWVQVLKGSPLGDDDVKAYIEQAHTIVARKLTQTLRRELGLDQ